MAIVSGIASAINGESHVRRFSFSKVGRYRPYSASNLEGGTATVAPVIDWNGWYSGLVGAVTPWRPANFPGSTFELKASTDGSSGVVCAGGFCIVDSLVVRGSVENGGPVEYMIRVSGNGALTPGAAVATDTADVLPCDSADLDVKINDSSQGDIRDVVMEITCKNRAYVSSDTSGLVKRLPGVINARVMWRRYDDGAGIATLDDNQVVKVYMTDTVFWTFTRMRVAAIQDFNVDHEGAEPASVTMMATMHGVIVTTDEVGSIQDPASAYMWGAAPTP